MFCKDTLTRRIIKKSPDINLHCTTCRYEDHELTKRYGYSKYFITLKAGTGQITYAHIDTPEHYISIDFGTPRTNIWRMKDDEQRKEGEGDYKDMITLTTANFDLHDYDAFIRQLKMFILFS